MDSKHLMMVSDKIDFVDELASTLSIKIELRCSK